MMTTGGAAASVTVTGAGGGAAVTVTGAGVSIVAVVATGDDVAVVADDTVVVLWSTVGGALEQLARASDAAAARTAAVMRVILMAFSLLRMNAWKSV